MTGTLLRSLAASARGQLTVSGRLAGLLTGVVQPAVFLTVAGLAAGSTAVSGQAAIGCGLLGLWGSTVWQFGLVLRAERVQGTLAGILCRPAGLTVVLVGKGLTIVIRSAVLVGVTIAVLTAAAGVPIQIARPVQFAVALAATLASAVALGLLLSAVFLLTRSAVRIAETLTYPAYILGGLLVPIGLLPSWVAPLSTVVSLRWAVGLLTDAAAGRPARPTHWLLLLGITAGYAVASWLALRAVARRVRSEGTLELV